MTTDNREFLQRLGWVYGFCYASIAARWGSRIRRTLVHEQTSKLLHTELSKQGLTIPVEQLGRFSRGPSWGRIRDHLILRDLIVLTEDGLILGDVKNRRKTQDLFSDELRELVEDFKASELERVKKESLKRELSGPQDLYDEMFGDLELEGMFEDDADLAKESDFGVAVIWECVECGEPAQECGHNDPGDVNLVSSDIVQWSSVSDQTADLLDPNS